MKAIWAVPIIASILILGSLVLSQSAFAFFEYPDSFIFGSQGFCPNKFVVPEDITVDSAGNVYVISTRTEQVQVYDSNFNFLLCFGSEGTADGQFNNPNAIEVDSVGNIYVSDAGNDRIQKFDSNGNHLLTFGSGFSFPKGLGIDSAGNVYVADQFKRNVQVYDSDGNFLLTFGSIGSGDGQFNTPSDITVDNADNVYVLESGNDRIQVFDSDLNHLLTFGSRFGTGLESPNGIAVDIGGNIYVANSFKNQVQIYDSDGNLQLTFGSGFKFPQGIAVDSTGNIYVADSNNNRLQIFLHHDDSFPTISITSPSELDIIDSDFTVIGTASDDHGIDVVEISIDGGGFLPATGLETWTFDASTSDTAFHTITAKVTDSVTHSVSTSIEVITVEQSGLNCGDGTVPEETECVVDPAITKELADANLLIDDLEDIIDQLQDDLESLFEILLSGEITICHNDSKTITVSLGAFGKHFLHGDAIGTCE